MTHSVLFGLARPQSSGMLRQAVPHNALGLLERRLAVSDLVVRMDVVPDCERGCPAHFFGAKAPVWTTVECAWRAGACAAAHVQLSRILSETVSGAGVNLGL